MSNITKIEIMGNFDYCCSYEGYDDLILTNNSISYEYFAFDENEKYADIKWSYSTDSPTFKERFKEIENIIEDKDKEWINQYLDFVGSVEFNITYDDNTIFNEKYYTSRNQFSSLFDVIKSLIPKVEKVPKVLITTQEEWIENVGRIIKKGDDKMRNIIGFHNPDENYGYLSNWYLSDFIVDDIKFSSMEQYIMYKKAMIFKDKKVAKQILNTKDVGKIKALGRSVENYNDSIWNGVRQVIIYKGLLEKFKQNENLLKLLLDTNDDILAECAVKDKIWGIGLSMKDPKRLDMDCWLGQNLLGFSLMLVREELRSTKG